MVVHRDGISLARLVSVAPLALIAALGVNYAVKLVAQQLNPAYQRMPMLQQPMLVLTIEGVLAAVIVFIGVALVVPRPIFWYRVLGVIALLVSLLPDIALAIGGQPMFTTLRLVGTLTSIGVGAPGAGGPPPGSGGPPPAGGQGGPGGPGGGGFTMSIDQVAILMALHVATAIVCIGLLTTLTRSSSKERLAAAS
jgi:hypothetical protein